MKATVILAMLPLALLIGPPRPAAPVPEIVTVAVTTEGVRRVDMDTRTFNARWTPVNAMPPMVLAAARNIPGTVEPLPEGVRPQLQDRKLHPRNIIRRTHDVCTRHRLKKVWVSSKRWRCR